MKRFVFKSLLFIVIGAPVFWGLHGVVYTHFRTPHNHMIRSALKKAGETHSYDRVIVGDSVAHQFFNDANQKKSRYLHLTTNAATTMLGQYVLLMELMKNNALHEIIIIMNPYSFTDDLNREFTANYVVGPLFREKYMQYFTDRAIRQVKNTFWWFLPLVMYQFPEFCQLNYQKVNPKPYDEDYYLSPLSIEYLKLIQNLCREKGIELRLISPPVPDEQQNLNTIFFKGQIEENGLQGSFKEYFPLKYCSNNQFADELHAKKQFVDDFRNSLSIEWIQ